MRLWDVATGQMRLTLTGHGSIVPCVAFSLDGKRLASGGFDGTKGVWDAATGQEILVLRGHTDWIKSVCFSPDGQRLVSGGEDRTVRVWDADSEAAVLLSFQHTDYVRSVVFSPDGCAAWRAVGWTAPVTVCDAACGWRDAHAPRDTRLPYVE